jgi:hypothetical protein
MGANIALVDPAAPPPVPASDDDDGLIDKVAEVVGEVLGEDLEPEPEGPWERRQRRLDAWTAVLLGVAAFLTAWATFQASQWSEREADADAAAARLRGEAGRATSDAGRAELVDSDTWLHWIEAVSAGQDDRAEFLSERFSPPLADAHQRWLAGVEVDSEGVPSVIPPGTPMDQEGYVVPERIRADELAAGVEVEAAAADEASSNATRFVLLAVVLALVLLLASVANKFTEPKLQVLLLCAAISLLVFSLVRVLILPHVF